MGACSKICGSEHIFMPIAIKGVSINLFSNTIGRKDFHVITPWQIWHRTSCNEIALELFKFHIYIMTIFIGIPIKFSFLKYNFLWLLN